MAFDKFKRFLGVGTLSVTITSPDTVDLATGRVDVVADIVAKGDCEVTSVEFTLVHEWYEDNHSGFDDDRPETSTRRTREIGRTKLPGFTIAEGEQRTVTGEIGFTPKNIGVLDDKLREKGGVLGKIGELGLLSGATGTYEVAVSFDVVGAANDPDDRRTVRVL